MPIHSIIFFDLSFSVSIQWLPQSWFLVRRDKLMKQHLNHRIPSLNCIMSSQQWGMCLSLQTGRSLKTHYAVLEKKFKLRHKTNLCWSENELLLCLMIMTIMTIISVVQDGTPMVSINLAVTWEQLAGHGVRSTLYVIQHPWQDLDFSSWWCSDLLRRWLQSLLTTQNSKLKLNAVLLFKWFLVSAAKTHHHQDLKDYNLWSN